MEMTTEHRRKTGAYYTPRPWAELAVRYLRGVLPEFDRCIFYDPAADLATLRACDGVCMLRGWGRSRSAQIERRAALKRGMPIYTFSEDRQLILLTDVPPHTKTP